MCRFDRISSVSNAAENMKSAQSKSPLIDDPTSWIQRLSPRRQEIIRQVLKNPREYVLLSVRSAAERLSTDPATMVRIIQKMGFESYRAFQNYLHDLSIANATSLDGMQAHSNGDAKTPDHLQAMLEVAQKDVSRLQLAGVLRRQE